MDSRTTQGTSRASMIILATVVFPDALPPPKPVGRRVYLAISCRGVDHVDQSLKASPHTAITNGKGLLGLRAMFIVPRWPPGCVDGTFACAKQGWL